MRILFANDGFADAGGVHSYLISVMTGLCGRQHDLAYLHGGTSAPNGLCPALKTVPCFDGADTDLERAVSNVRAWGPEVIFSHNMGFLDVEQRLLDEWPVIKLMHGYFGTCIGGQKMFALPGCRPCARRFGAACLALYLPRRCGEFSPRKMLSQYLWARRQKALFNRYAAVVVASEHMKREYVRNGMKSEAVYVNPLFPTEAAEDCRLQIADCRFTRPDVDDVQPASSHVQVTPQAQSAICCDRVLFLGRMTKLKGGDFLIRAVAQASQRLGRTIHLIMAGDGPQRPRWEKLTARLKISALFTGWVTEPQRERLLSSTSLLALPSIWPEPFGLTGLEAARFGVPAIAFDVGGIRQWLTDGCNGWLVSGNPPTVSGLSDGLVRALSTPDQLFAMREGARQTARRMSLAAHLDRLENILGAACGQRYQTV